MSTINPSNAKSQQYSEALSEIEKAKVCPFCPSQFPGQWHTNPILKESKGWLITRNMFPYPDTSEHLLIVGTRHIENITEITPEDYEAILELAQWAVLEFNIAGGFLGMRFGDPLFTGATVKHLHAHIISPSKKSGKISIVNFPIG